MCEISPGKIGPIRRGMPKPTLMWTPSTGVVCATADAAAAAAECSADDASSLQSHMFCLHVQLDMTRWCKR